MRRPQQDKEEIFKGVEKILDEWDPIGILQDIKPISYYNGAIGEYSKYIKPIIEVYLSNSSVYDFLINLQTDLRNYPNEEMKEEIKLVSQRIIIFLSKNFAVGFQDYH